MNSKVKNKIKILRKLINNWNYFYYFKNKSKVSDQVYDIHYRELIELERKYPNLISKKSPTKNIGYIIQNNLQKIVHKKSMLSLNNAFLKKELIDFDIRIKKVTYGENSYFCESKIDGLSISLIFKNNKFFYAATRGNGKIGENVTKNILQIDSLKNLSKNSYFLKNFEIRGEVYMTNNQFLKLNNFVKERQKKKIKKFIEKKHFEYKLSIVFLEKNFIINKNILFLYDLNNFEEQINLFGKKKEFIFNVTIPILRIYEIIKIYKKIGFKILLIKKNILKLKLEYIFSETQFLNPRNAASGSLRQLNELVTKERNLSVFFYDLIQNEIEIKTQKESLLKIKELGFPIDDDYKLCNDIKEVLNFIEKQTENKIKKFNRDGIVIKTNENKYYDEIGKTEKYPNYSIAWKFPEKIIETKLLDIFSTVGRTGKITYNAKFKKIFLKGSIIKAATLHNADYIKKLDIRIGDFIKVKKAGSVIPKIIAFNKINRKKNLIKWKEDNFCPSCKQKLIILDKEVDQYCFNNFCKEKMIQELIHFVSRDVMNIFGISEKIIRTFWDLNLLRKSIDFYKFKYIEGKLFELIKNKILINWGEKSINNLLTAIEMSKNNTWDRLIFGLNIRYIGNKIAKLLAYNFGTIDKLIEANQKEIELINGIGPSVANAIFFYFQKKENRNLINEFKKFGLNFDSLFLVNENGYFKYKKICITGTFSISRREIISKLEKQGAKFVSNISLNTNFLLLGKNPGSKLLKAQKLNINIINELKFFKLSK